ncbi:hypothetical protein SAMN00768000_0160 [Sulfobacillus thermosulfidooxidans DSM 9293]|uniref:CobQ/CobB/MinD/ParA nucleotide binding domain-containing protein n=1 Tax=Sulfobacillus thermosulfidooxidans (strain DSM 9293 / VKM B-1269 / AT-1) TaxID=929705 RepID=A0A1W1W6M0_SULTA|nr:hypothetical protein [Sulfobacillus thermosulfidooxidans]SMC01928.1 hypothetical protein SAMN00768000_0160 [Sulfobacillus thermosulfidooxidans DSM 9293]
MAWQCRIVADAETGNPEEDYRTPMAVVYMAERVALWPETLRIPGEQLPTDPAIRDQWEQACRTLTDHGTRIWIDETVWDPTTPLRLQWPTGNPMQWPWTTPGAWDADTACLTSEAGAVWWQRQTGTGPWVIGVVHMGPDWSGTPEDIVAALTALLPPDAARVRVSPTEWWCAWPRTVAALSGAEWQRQMWATLGAITVGTSLVTGDPQQWERSWRQAQNAKSAKPTTRVKGLSPEAAQQVQQAVQARMQSITAEHRQRRDAVQRHQAAQHEAERAAAAAAEEEARLQAEKWELERTLANLREQERAQAQARVAQLAQEVAALRQQVWERERASAPEASSPASDKGASEVGVPDAEPARPSAPQPTASQAADVRLDETPTPVEPIPASPQNETLPLTNVVEDPKNPENPGEDSPQVSPSPNALERAASNPELWVPPGPWRTAPPPQWDAPKPVTPPRRLIPSSGGPLRMSPESVASSSSGEEKPAAPISPPALDHRPEPSETGRQHPEPVFGPSGSGGVSSHLVQQGESLSADLRYWVWGNQRRAGATTTAVALARFWAQFGQRVLLLDGHLAHPGILKIFFPGDDAPIRPGLGWDAQWIAGQPWCEPPQALIRETLTVWAMALPVRVPREAERWRRVLQRLPDVPVVVIDGGVMPPPTGGLIGMCVIEGMVAPVVPTGTTRAWRHGAGARSGDLVLPSEPLGWDGVGGPAWQAVPWPGRESMNGMRSDSAPVS